MTVGERWSEPAVSILPPAMTQWNMHGILQQYVDDTSEKTKFTEATSNPLLAQTKGQCKLLAAVVWKRNQYVFKRQQAILCHQCFPTVTCMLVHEEGTADSGLSWLSSSLSGCKPSACDLLMHRCTSCIIKVYLKAHRLTWWCVSFSTLAPFTATTRSPARSPDSSAGEPSSTLRMNCPLFPFSPCKWNPYPFSPFVMTQSRGFHSLAIASFKSPAVLKLKQDNQM